MAKRGRPATFDRSEALEGAMEVFWARGYEGTTLEDLQAAMGGISPPSLYHAFGSKEALFKATADLYVARVGGPQLRALARLDREQRTSQAAVHLAVPVHIAAEARRQARHADLDDAA